METALGLILKPFTQSCVICGDGTQWKFGRNGRAYRPLCFICQSDIAFARVQQNRLDEQVKP